MCLARLAQGHNAVMSVSTHNSGGSRGGSRGSLDPPSPSPFFKYPMKMKKFGLNETKLFHFHGKFMKNQIELAKKTLYTFLHIKPLSRDPGNAPAQHMFLLGNKKNNFQSCTLDQA